MKRVVRARDFALLSEAIDKAEEWRGELMPEDWPEFDKRIADMRRSLARVIHTRDVVASLQAANRRLGRTVERLL